MSGGSLNYLYNTDAYDLFSEGKIEDLLQAIRSLEALSVMDLSENLKKVHKEIESAKSSIDQHFSEDDRKLLKALEWYLSADTDKAEFERSVEVWRNASLPTTEKETEK